MKSQIIPAIKAFLFLTILTGLIYPLMITLISQATMKEKSNGSLISEQGKVVGSELIAQKFSKPQYFWPRPSAVDYKPMPGGATNLGPTSKALKQQVEDRKAQGAVGDMLFNSGSGLDPHISVLAAKSQIERVFKARNLADTSTLDRLIDQLTEKRDLGFLGEERVNVLKLNLALDAVK